MKSIVIYFSRAGENYGVGNIEKGNTEVIAEYIRESAGAELFKCEPVKEYSENYAKCCNEALAYRKQNARPALKRYLDNIDGYDVVYIGGPIYFGEYPHEIYTQLDKLNFRGKVVKPFATHEGSGLGICEKVLREKCAGATVKAGLVIRGKSVHSESAKEEVKNWVKE